MTYRKALHAYQRAQQSALSPRYMERTVFARAISALKQARENVGDYPAYAAALKYNQRLWTYIQADLAENGSNIPGDIKTSLLNLSIFIDRHTISALAAPGPEKLDALIDIDIDIFRGLDTNSAVPTTSFGNISPDHGFLPN